MFKPYGKPPPFDFDEYHDSFELWEMKWQVFLTLLTIDTMVEDARRLYKAHTLLSCLSTAALKAVMSMGLTATKSSSTGCVTDAMRVETDTYSVRNLHPRDRKQTIPRTTGSASYAIWPANVN